MAAIIDEVTAMNASDIESLALVPVKKRTHRYTIDEVKEIVESKGYTLLSDTYVKSSNSIQISCRNNHNIEVTFKHFLKYDYKCSKCLNVHHNRLGFDEVKNFIESKGCTLLSTEYTNSHKKLTIRCILGHIQEISLSNFKKGRRCVQCKKDNPIKQTYNPNFFEKVKADFAQRGFTLLSNNYENGHTILHYICPNQHENYSSYLSFQYSSGCFKCSGITRYTYEYVQNYFMENGCTLLEKEYVSNHTLMKYICVCGNESKIIFSSFMNGHRCYMCGKNKKKNKIEDVAKYFEDNGCKLLSTYENAESLLRYICSCGNESEISYTCFVQNQRCKNCRRERYKSTCLERYGCEHPSQLFQTQEKIRKSGRTWKEYTLPSGQVVKYQGYENLAFDDLLLEMCYNEDDVDIHCHDLANVQFMYYYDEMYRRYFPDIFLRNDNMIIEVKSRYTFQMEYEKNLAKAKCCTSMGYDFEFWIYDEKRNKEIKKYKKDYTLDFSGDYID